MMLAAAIPAHVKIDWLQIWMKMGWLDIVFLVAFGLGVVMGLRRGLASVMPRVLEVMTAQVVALEYGKLVSEFIQSRIQISFFVVHFVVFSALAVTAIVTIRVLFQVVSAFATFDFKSPLKGVGGAVLGGLHYFLFLGLVSSLLILIPLPFIQDTYSSRSISGPFLAESSVQVHDFFAKWLPESWRAR